jgi:hypothetical protein
VFAQHLLTNKDHVAGEHAAVLALITRDYSAVTLDAGSLLLGAQARDRRLDMRVMQALALVYLSPELEQHCESVLAEATATMQRRAQRLHDALALRRCLWSHLVAYGAPRTRRAPRGSRDAKPEAGGKKDHNGKKERGGAWAESALSIRRQYTCRKCQRDSPSARCGECGERAEASLPVLLCMAGKQVNQTGALDMLRRVARFHKYFPASPGQASSAPAAQHNTRLATHAESVLPESSLPAPSSAPAYGPAAGAHSPGVAVGSSQITDCVLRDSGCRGHLGDCADCACMAVGARMQSCLHCTRVCVGRGGRYLQTRWRCLGHAPAPSDIACVGRRGYS